MSLALTVPRSKRLFFNMKSSALLVLLVSAAAGYSEVPVVPERLPLDRYQKLKSDPPFAVKTPDQPVEEKKIDWAESLYLSGASKFVENGAEKDWVYINHKSDPSGAFQLYGTEPNAQGIQIVKLEWHPENPVSTKVTLKKGTEFATLERDKAAFSGPPPMAAQPPGGRPPGQPIMPGSPGAIRQPTTPQRGPVIPRPTAAIPAPQPTLPQAAPGAAPAQGSDRRRIRVINSR